ncbi:uncharacterized protein LOC130666008 [Microplitis mediator]|uniref:uncharacterized protein LOC130666008 n=1 Tax=Microplitis mediator TaxID=375433 RepID=UPI00255381E8|nr:uncharacterized protein LOC130666008 [Microplitis mediator]
METDYMDGIQNKLISILNGIKKVRDDLDHGSEETKFQVEELGDKVKEMEENKFNVDSDDDSEVTIQNTVDFILEEVKLIKKQVMNSKKEIKGQLIKLGEAIGRVEKKSNKKNGDAVKEIKVQLAAALEAARRAEERLAEEKKEKEKYILQMELMFERINKMEDKWDRREREFDTKLEDMKNKITHMDDDSSSCSAIEDNDKNSARETSFSKMKIAQDWPWKERQEDRKNNIIIKGLEVDENDNNIVDNVNDFIEIKLNTQIKAIAAKYQLNKNKERELLVKLESEEDVEEIMRRHKLGSDGIFIDYQVITPQRELRKQLKIIVEKQLKHAS